ncbi:MAG: aminoacyl-tRNA hydrolase [bacterium]
MRLIAGLGNPGIKYNLTRHNTGFFVIEELAKIYNLNFKNEPKFQSYTTEAKIDNKKIIFSMPLTYMNNSGMSVSRLAKFYKISFENIIVIHDDIDLPFGKIRISFGASSGGHNGVESIIRDLGTKDFIRLRIGIGNEISQSRKILVEKFVLQKFLDNEKKLFSAELPRYVETINFILKNGYKKAMEKFN